MNLRLAIRKTARSSDDRAVFARLAEMRRSTSKVAGEYGFLRVTSQGYNLGSNPDPDGLLPTVFPANE